MDLVARGGDDRDVEEDRLGALAQDREEGDESEAQQGTAAQRGVRLLLDVLVPRLVGGLVDHPVGDPDQHDDREERGEALEELLVGARQGGHVAEEEGQADGQSEGERHAAPHDRGLLLVAGLGQVGQDRGDDQDRLHALAQDDEEGGQELGDPRGGARAIGGVVGRLAGVAVEGVGVLADVVRQRREVLVDGRRVVVGHGLLEEGELHLHLGDARAGDAAHDLLLHAGDLVVLVVGLVDLVLAGLGVAALVGVGAVLKDAVDGLGDLTPRAGAVVVRRGLGGSTGGHAVQGGAVFDHVLLEGRSVAVDARAVAVGHGLLEEGELHLHLRDACTGDAGHDLLLHAGDLVVLVVGVVDFVLAALGVARLVGGHAFVDQAIDRGRHIAPRLIRGAGGRGEHRHGQSRHHGDDEDATESLTNVVYVSANIMRVSAKHCHRLPPVDPAIR